MVPTERAGSADAAHESFRLADSIRGRSVQNALAASSARALAGNPELARRIREVQDAEKQITAQFGALNRALSLGPADRNEGTVKTLRADIDKLRSDLKASAWRTASAAARCKTRLRPRAPVL